MRLGIHRNATEGSTTTSEATSGRKGRDWSPKFSRTIKFYDVNFDLKEAKAEGEIVPATDLQGIYNLGLSTKEIVQAANTAAKNKKIAEESEKVMGADAVPEVVLMKFIEPLRMIPRFAAITDKAKQTAAVILKVKSDEDLIAALRAAVTAAQTEDTAE